MASSSKSAASAAMVVFGALASLCAGSAAQEQYVTGAVRPASVAPVSYYVEFRAAEIGVYGHSYIAYGRLGANGRPVTAQYADFHPQGGNIGLVAGHVLPVAGGVTPEKETMALPLSSVFRRKLTAAEYARLTAAVKAAHDNTRVWNAIAYNCNSFVAEVAHAIGMRTPPTILFASAFIPALRDMNGMPAEAQTVKRGMARKNEAVARQAPTRAPQPSLRQPSI